MFHTYLALGVRTLPSSYNQARLYYSLLSFHPADSDQRPEPCQKGRTSIALALPSLKNGNPSLSRMERNPQFQRVGFGRGLCPFRSPLLGTSHLISFLSLNDMLKFSEFPGIPPDIKFVSVSKTCHGRMSNPTPVLLPKKKIRHEVARCIRRVKKSIHRKSFNLLNIDSSFLGVEP